ncbi:MAG: hypothetical protein LRY73_06705 [Bacillus sp. (in: Bacteria)]|nr:hypothetical protein [Bacillus sp. (in: firmicutes)]
MDTLEYLKELCTNFPFQEKILIVDSYAIGEQIISNYTRAGNQSINLKKKTVRDLGRELVERNVEKPFDYLEQTVGVQLLYSILKKLKDEGVFQYFTDFEVTLSFSRAMYENVKLFRLSGFTYGNLQEEAFISVEKGKDMRQIIKKYEDTLAVLNLMDEADLLREAMKVAKRNDNVVFILQSNLSVSFLENELLRIILPVFTYKLPLRKVLGVPIPEKTTIRSISWGSPSPYSFLYDLENRMENKSDITLLSATTEEIEVKAVLQRVKENKSKLDDCVLYYTTRHPYVTTLYQIAEKTGLPISFGEGVPITYTRTGQLVKFLLEWMRDEYSVTAFIEMINGGVLELEEGAPSKFLIIKLLRDAQIGWNKSRYITQLEAAQSRIKDKLTTADNDNYKEYLVNRLHQLSWLHQWFSRIFKKLPNVGEMVNTKELMSAVQYFFTKLF